MNIINQHFHYQNEAQMSKKPKIGHLGLLAQTCLKYSIEFEQIRQSALAASVSSHTNCTFRPNISSSSQSSIRSNSDSQSTSSSLETPIINAKKVKSNTHESKNEKLKMKDEIIKKKMKLEKLNKKLERKLELINQNKLDKLKAYKSKHHHHNQQKSEKLKNSAKIEKSTQIKPNLEKTSQPTVTLPPIHKANIIEPDLLNEYYKTKSIIENLMLISSTTSSSSSSVSPVSISSSPNATIANYSNPSYLMSSPYNLHFSQNLISNNINNNYKHKRYNPYDSNMKPSFNANKSQLPSLNVRNQSNYDFYVPPILK